MSAQHTPGPWFVTRLTGRYAAFELQPASNRARKRALGNDSTGAGSVQELEADARLIAAAPDLLAELRHAHALLHLALQDMSPEQLARFARASDQAGIGIDGASRRHERAEVIARATGAAS